MPFDGNPQHFAPARTREDILRDWCHELRHGGHVQICGQTSDGHGGVCALGVGIDHVPGFVAMWVQQRATRLILLSGEVAARNDGRSGHRRHTFPEIADYIEREWLHSEPAA